MSVEHFKISVQTAGGGRGATIRVLDRAYIDLTSPIGRGFMAFISAMAEDERLRIIKRTHEGRAIARENGVKMAPSSGSMTCSVPRPASAWPTARRPTILPNSMASAAPRSIVCACKSELAERTGRFATPTLFELLRPRSTKRRVQSTRRW